MSFYNDFEQLELNDNNFFSTLKANLIEVHNKKTLFIYLKIKFIYILFIFQLIKEKFKKFNPYKSVKPVMKQLSNKLNENSNNNEMNKKKIKKLLKKAVNLKSSNIIDSISTEATDLNNIKNDDTNRIYRNDSTIACLNNIENIFVKIPYDDHTYAMNSASYSAALTSSLSISTTQSSRLTQSENSAKSNEKTTKKPSRSKSTGNLIDHFIQISLYNCKKKKDLKLSLAK